MKLKIAVAMSGGVDSSMTARKLVQAGHDVLGVYVKLHTNDVAHEANIANVSRVCALLGIPYEVIERKEDFARFVVTPFIEQYRAGLTPNPCTFCNRHIKFGALLEFVHEKGYSHLATGHYVKTDGHFLYEAADKTKDQSYFLFNVKQTALSSLLFPLGETIKHDLKAEAATIKEFAFLAVQKESSEICFAPTDYVDVLKEHGIAVDMPGDVYDEAGHCIGHHRGYMHYTIGKRRGFDVPLSHDPLYVKEIDAAHNRLVVAAKDAVSQTSFHVSSLNMFTHDTEFDAYVKVRYKSQKVAAHITINGDDAFVSLHEPQFAIARGQAAVFYDGERVIGGGYV